MSDVASKWGEPVAARGFAQVPNYLLLINQFLKDDHRLSSTELLVLVQLVGSWWRKDAMPFPSMSTLAVRCGVSSRQIQRAVNQLEKVGLVKRVNRRTQGIISSNAYDLTPLTQVLNEVAKAFPNQFPRKVDQPTIERISGLLSPGVVQSAQVQEPIAEDTPAPAPEQVPALIGAPKRRRRRIRTVQDLPGAS